MAGTSHAAGFGVRMRRGVRRRARLLIRSVLRRSLLFTARFLSRLHRAPTRGERLRIRFLVQHAYGMGGTTRTVLNLAAYLGDRYDVEIVSMSRGVAKPFYDVPKTVSVTWLVDYVGGPRGRLGRLLRRLPSMIVPPKEASYSGMSLAHDLRLVALMGGRQPDVVIGTRPSQNLLIAETSRPGVLTIGQCHTSYGAQRKMVQEMIQRSYRRLDALAVLTDTSRAEYEKVLGDAAPRLVRIPNAVPPLGGGLSPRTDKVVIAAGRFVYAKGFDLLIQAYETVALKHPDWTLRIFGAGNRRDQLKRLIEERGLGEQIRLMPRTAGLGEELARSSIYALSSRFEGFGLVIVEAMSKGVPTVAFDCPTGPAALINPRENGLLVPAGDLAGFGQALLELIEDPELRDRLGEQGRITARAYDLGSIGAMWDGLLAELCSGKTE